MLSVLGSCNQQFLHNIIVAALGGIVQGGVLHGVHIGDIGPIVQESSHNVVVPMPGGDDQRRLAVFIALVNFGGMGQQVFYDMLVFIVCCSMQGELPLQPLILGSAPASSKRSAISRLSLMTAI